MTDRLSWWHRFRNDLLRGGFHEFEDTPSRSTAYESGGEAACPEESCGGRPEYHDFLRGGEYLGFIVCARCGGVWGAETLERFH